MATKEAVSAICRYTGANDSAGIARINLSSRHGSSGFILRPLGEKDIDSILALQNRVVESLCDKSILQKSTTEEILESTEEDLCCGLFCDDVLCAFCIAVTGRSCDRNLGIDWLDTEDADKISDFVTFDTVQVLPEYRGFGIQKLFLELSEVFARMCGARMLAATVSPDNSYSRDNFARMGYLVHPTKNPYGKYDSLRLLVGKRLD